MKKRLMWGTALVATLLCLALAGCGADGQEQKPDPGPGNNDNPTSQGTTDNGNQEPDDTKEPVVEKKTAKEMADEILGQIEFPEMVEQDEKRIKLFYSLSAETYDDASVYLCGDTVDASELAIITAKEGQVDTVLKGIEERLVSQRDTFADYAPDQAQRCADAKTAVNGNTVFMVISSDNAKCEEIFNSFFGS